ncbi:MAG: hypothetical protein GY851_36875, partial [bacterium]|nr:hypothetical protein [bacterium]
MTISTGQLDAVHRDRGRLIAALKEAGAKITGSAVRCPFHDDKHPSGSVHQSKGGAWLYTCQTDCGWNDGKRSGDVIAVVRRSMGCNFKD